MPVASSSSGKVLKRAIPGTIHDKFLVGYQGWFTCGGDGRPIGDGHHGWLHWVNEPIEPPFNGRPNTDLWPDTTEYEPSELYAVAGLAHRDGSPAKVFSSRDPRTVRRHFRWMAEHGVDGAFLQRFAGQVDPEEPGNRDARFGGTRRLRDEVGERVREAAEAEGRVWAIMYDVSGVPADKILRIISQDFAHLVHTQRIFHSPAYLRERGRPVIGVWGFGLSDSSVPPATARAVFDVFRAQAGEDVYVFAGTPSHWRTPGEGDAHADPTGEWAALWLGTDGVVDAISPWSVGRFGSAVEVEAWARERWGPDAEHVEAHNEGAGGRRVDYVPVVLPGGSGFNLSEGKWGFNNIKRDGGKFLWSQIFAATRLKGVRTLYGAMWDEYDEGTAFLPVVPKKRLLPESERWPFLSLDEDGYDLPADWYMRVAGFAAEALRSERRVFDSFPSKELQDYWGGGKRPRYEEDSAVAAAGSGSAAGAGGTGAEAGMRSSLGAAPAPMPPSQPQMEDEEGERQAREAKAQYDAWVEEQRRKEAETEDAPPPAYSLEDEGPGVQAQQAQQPQQRPAAVQQSQRPASVQQPQQIVQVQQPQRPVSVPQPSSQMQQQHPPVQVQQRIASPPRQQQQQYSVASHHSPQPNYTSRPGADDTAIGALATDFVRQSRINADRPSLHPVQRGESHDASGRNRVHSNASLERPPLHPTQVGRVGSYDSGRSNSSGSVSFERPPLHPSHPSAGRVPSTGAQQGSQQQHTGGLAPASAGGYGQYPQGQSAPTSPHLAHGLPYPQQQSASSSSAGGYGQYPQGQSAPTSPHVAQRLQYQQQQQQNDPQYQQQQSASSSSAGGYGHYPQGQSAPTSPNVAQGPQYQQQQQQQLDPHRHHQQHTSAPAPSSSAGGYSAHSVPYLQYPPEQIAPLSPRPGQGSQYQQQHDPYRQQQQHIGNSAAHIARPTAGYPGQAAHAPPVGAPGAPPHIPPRPSPAHPGQSPGSGYPPSPGRPGFTAPLRPSSAYPDQASSAAAYVPPVGPPSPLNPPRPASAYPGHSAAAAAAYTPPAGSSLGHSASLSARPSSDAGYASASGLGQHASLPTTSMYPSPSSPPQGHSSLRPDSAALRPSTPGGFASYPAPSGPPPSLAPRPESARPTTPGYRPPAGPTPHHAQYPPPHNAYPSSSHHPPPSNLSLPSPKIAGPAFPPGPMSPPLSPGQYGAPYPPYPNQSFPGSPPPGAPSFPPSPSPFPQGGPDSNPYFYQQPQQQFPGAPYSPPQPDPYNNNYASQPQGSWAMPHQPGYGPPMAYGPGPGGPGYPTSSPSSSSFAFADNFVGRRTREQVEGTVDKLSQSSSKILNKFL